MADVDTYPFGDHDIRQTHILTREVKLFLSTQEEKLEDLLGNQKQDKKHHLEK